MKLSIILGQMFRDYSGMPTKVTGYNNRLNVYEEIISNVSEIEKNSIEYLNNSNDIDWRTNQAKSMKLNFDVSNGKILPEEYALLLKEIDMERRQLVDAFVSNTDLYFVIAYIERLNSIKTRYVYDRYISLMKFDDWFDMEEAREIAEFAVLQIKTDEKYIDAKKIAEIREKYLHERFLRRGR